MLRIYVQSQIKVRKMVPRIIVQINNKNCGYFKVPYMGDSGTNKLRII
jgi:hypothetical protein